MSTRSLTRVIDRQEGLDFADGHEHLEKSYINMYRHYDGYPKGHGVELAEFLRDFRVVNGLGSPRDKKIANGTGCLAAQIVAHFKTEPGQIYLYPCNDGEEGVSWEDYTYTVWPKEGEPTWISIYNNLINECIFVGTAENLIEKYAGTEEIR
tara:strand:- start:29 stop:484 length:456 start_codon:yes stop_codon:yes gene_type:complete